MKLPEFHIRSFSSKKFLLGVSFLIGVILGYVLGFSKSNALLSPLFMGLINLSWFNDLIHNPLWLEHSSYNLGVAITAIAIIVAFIEFIASRNELKFKLNYRKRRIALWLAIFSIVLTFLGEFNLFRPFIFEISGALLMFFAILIYLHVIFSRLKKLSEKQIEIFQDILIGVLSNTHTNKLKTIEGSIELFDNLLELSLKNKTVKNIFVNDFASTIFLEYFSESGYVFDRTIKFYIEKSNEGESNLRHLKFFLKRLFTKSLENNESFLNTFLRQEIYPEALFYLDEVMLKEKNNRILNVLFEENRFNGLTNAGQLNYVAVVNRYFKLIYQENNHVSLKNGYQKNYDFNDELIKVFYKEIKNFFEGGYDQKHLEMLLDKVKSFSWYYRWGVKTEDKTENIRRKTGEFLYDVFYCLIGKYKIENEEIFRLKVHELYDHFIEIQENGIENNVAYNVFTEKLKTKILGNHDEHFPNYKGYFPAMLLVYFYIFGFYAFSENQNETQTKNLHIPILSKLAESFPKLYQGFKQEFYDVNSLPEEKKDLLEKQGREILDKFLKKNMVYNFKENSLSYYYSGNIHSSKIFLNEVKNEQKIKPRKL